MRKLALVGLAAAFIVGGVAPTLAKGWRHHHRHHHAHFWHMGPGVYKDNPIYLWAPYSVVSNVLVHRSIEVGPIERLVIVK